MTLFVFTVIASFKITDLIHYSKKWKRWEQLTKRSWRERWRRPGGWQVESHMLICRVKASCKFSCSHSVVRLKVSPSHRPWLQAYDVLHPVMTPLTWLCLRIYSMTGVCVVRPQADITYSELDVLSEQHIQKCLQQSSSQENSKSRETMLGCKERELEQLRRENQVYAHLILNTYCRL